MTKDLLLLLYYLQLEHRNSGSISKNQLVVSIRLQRQAIESYVPLLGSGFYFSQLSVIILSLCNIPVHVHLPSGSTGKSSYKSQAQLCSKECLHSRWHLVFDHFRCSVEDFGYLFSSAGNPTFFPFHLKIRGQFSIQ